jgi:hypothetical protein
MNRELGYEKHGMSIEFYLLINFNGSSSPFRALAFDSVL